FHPVGPGACLGGAPGLLHHLIGHPTEQDGIRLGQIAGVVPMQFFVGRDAQVVATAVQRGVDRESQWSHRSTYPRSAASMVATSIWRICIIAWKTRPATAGSGWV